jgi:hypothetical protein
LVDKSLRGSPQAIRKCKKLITVSNFELNKIKESLKISDDRITYIYNGFGKHFSKIQDYQSVTSNYIKDTKYIFFLGNTDPKKNTESQHSPSFEGEAVVLVIRQYFRCPVEERGMHFLFYAVGLIRLRP